MSRLQQALSRQPDFKLSHFPQPMLEQVDRSKVAARLASGEVFDMIIIGGGRHGAAVAQGAAMNGLKVALLEGGDFAGATSSRLSDIAHGGLRYLKTLDFSQVFQGIKDREQMFRTAHHIVKPHHFDIPIGPHDGWFRAQLAVGLYAYDWFLKNPERGHKWIPSSRMDPEVKRYLGKTHTGAYRYCDGMMKSVRVVMESLCSARENGALTLNYAPVETIDTEGMLKVLHWRDALTGEAGNVRARVVVNCAGPWISQIPGVGGDIKVRFSQGTHLVFDTPWPHPCMYMPLPKGRSYFVLPSPAGTVVGTTERELSKSPKDPHPTADEVEEILARLARDLPNSKLNRDTLVFAYAGVRTLPVRKDVKDTSKISRKDEWIRDGVNVFTLSGGKFTTGNSTADKVIKLAYPLLGRRGNPFPVGEIFLPGTIGREERVRTFRAACAERGVCREITDATIDRLGGLAGYLHDLDPALSTIGSSMLRAEVLYHIRYEQAVTVNDILRIRLRADLPRGNGIALLNDVAGIVARERPGYDADGDVRTYLQHVEETRGVLGLTV